MDMQFVKLKSKIGEIHIVNTAHIIELRHLPKHNTYVIHLTGDRAIDISDESALWWIDIDDAAV